MEDMDDEQLAAAVYVWRKRASLGDPDASEMADKLDAELKSRIGPTPSMHGPLESLPEPSPKGRPWWRFW